MGVGLLGHLVSVSVFATYGNWQPSINLWEFYITGIESFVSK